MRDGDLNVVVAAVGDEEFTTLSRESSTGSVSKFEVGLMLGEQQGGGTEDSNSQEGKGDDLFVHLL